jgi:hypothetical protein
VTRALGQKRRIKGADEVFGRQNWNRHSLQRRVEFQSLSLHRLDAFAQSSDEPGVGDVVKSTTALIERSGVFRKKRGEFPKALLHALDSAAKHSLARARLDSIDG